MNRKEEHLEVTYHSSTIDDSPVKLLVRTDLRLRRDEHDELDFGIFGALMCIGDLAVGIVGKEFLVGTEHVLFRNQVEGFRDRKDLDCGQDIVNQWGFKSAVKANMASLQSHLKIFSAASPALMIATSSSR